MPDSRIDELKKLLDDDPRDTLAHYLLGLEYLKARHAEQAILSLRRAIELDPDYTAAYRRLGDAFTRAGRRAEAIDAYRQGIRVAEKTRDYQTGKECAAFLKRLQ